MHHESLERWRHDHVFGQDQRTSGETRTLIVAGITAVVMVAEVAGGIGFGSMALLADGLHMASHAVALGISVLAYVYGRRRARDARFAFGTGKVNALGGYTGALLLGGFAFWMAFESVQHWLEPVAIVYRPALLVAILGLAVNGLSALLLGHGHEHAHHSHEHSHARFEDHHSDHGHDHADGHEHPRAISPRAPHVDHNLRSAYLHVMADALTSVLAIFALLAGMYFQLHWLDPAMGVLGAVLVARWSVSLLRDTSKILLDHQAGAELQAAIRAALEQGDDRVTDLHVWSVAPGKYASAITLVSDHPRSPDYYRSLLPSNLGLVHPTFEIHACPGHA